MNVPWKGHPQSECFAFIYIEVDELIPWLEVTLVDWDLLLSALRPPLELQDYAIVFKESDVKVW